MFYLVLPSFTGLEKKGTRQKKRKELNGPADEVAQKKEEEKGVRADSKGEIEGIFLSGACLVGRGWPRRRTHNEELLFFY